MTVFEPAELGAPLDPNKAVTACIESGADALLLDQTALSPEFFDLSSGVAGNLVQRLQNYGIRMAAVVPSTAAHSRAFQEFAMEANTGGSFRFFPTREDAIGWLEATSRE